MSSLKTLQGVPYHLKTSTVRRIVVDGAHVRCICPEDVISHAYQLVNLDLNKVTVHEVTNIQVCFILLNICHGFLQYDQLKIVVIYLAYFMLYPSEKNCDKTIRKKGLWISGHKKFGWRPSPIPTFYNPGIATNLRPKGRMVIVIKISSNQKNEVSTNGDFSSMLPIYTLKSV